MELLVTEKKFPTVKVKTGLPEIFSSPNLFRLAL